MLNNKIITGVKPKTRPTYRDGGFDKEKPLHPHNFPLTKYTIWQIYGYKKEGVLGLKKPYWLTKTLPTGRPLTPKLVGLDGFYTVRPLNQID